MILHTWNTMTQVLVATKTNKHKHATKTSDYTTIADRLRTVSWSYYGTVTILVWVAVNRYYYPMLYLNQYYTFLTVTR